MINNVTGIILAGGKSTRMGVNKAFLKIGGCTIIEEIFSKFKNIFSRVIIIANEIERFNFLGAQITPDIIPSKGPLGGIYTGLIKSSSFHNFVTACDVINHIGLYAILEKTTPSSYNINSGATIKH